MRRGFTLAEVLITLGIIGVVAVLTIPALVASYQEKVLVTKLKKSYCAMSQAYLMAIAENGTPDKWDLTSETFLNVMTPYLKLAKNCGAAPGCFAQGGYMHLSGGLYRDIDAGTEFDGKAVMSDGALIGITVRSADCTDKRGVSEALSNICAIMAVDTNGKQPPNILGKDLFRFYVTKNTIVPEGTTDETLYKFDNCLGGDFGCTAWVLMNENMDYLHCNDLSWNGKTKCD